MGIKLPYHPPHLPHTWTAYIQYDTSQPHNNTNNKATLKPTSTANKAHTHTQDRTAPRPPHAHAGPNQGTKSTTTYVIK